MCLEAKHYFSPALLAVIHTDQLHHGKAPTTPAWLTCASAEIKAKQTHDLQRLQRTTQLPQSLHKNYKPFTFTPVRNSASKTQWEREDLLYFRWSGGFQGKDTRGHMSHLANQLACQPATVTTKCTRSPPHWRTNVSFRGYSPPAEESRMS